MTATLTAVLVTMPRLSDSMEEGTVAAWLKVPGDAVATGDALAEIETDKATMTYEAERDGVLGNLLVAEGETAVLGAPIAELLVEGAAGEEPGDAPASAPLASARLASPPLPAAPAAPTARVRATPVARRVAADLGVALATVTGSGPRGRIVRADVVAAAQRRPAASPAAAPQTAAPQTVAPQTAAPQTAAPSAAVPAEDEHVALTNVQRTIARRMVASRTEIPEFTLTAEIDMTAALALRRELRAARPDAALSVNDLIVKAAALALREHPALNASWIDDHVVRHRRVNVGIAVATDDALLVPTIFDADRRGLGEIGAAARIAGERARARTATAQELSGGTFTVTNLGMFGVLGFAAVINLPQVAILSAGAVMRRPVFAQDGSVVGRELMQVGLSCDHRAVYGADAARFLARVRELLEQPMALLLPPSGGSNEGDRR